MYNLCVNKVGELIIEDDCEWFECYKVNGVCELDDGELDFKGCKIYPLWLS